MGMATIGEFEHLVLLAILRLQDKAYGVAIRREIESRAGRSVATGAIYTLLARLERKGLVASRLGEPTPERGGRSKKFYRLQPAGERALSRAHAAVLAMALDMDLELAALGDRAHGSKSRT